LIRWPLTNWDGVNLTGDGTPEKVQDFLVTTNFFSTLGVQPHLGRIFLPEEGQPGQNQRLILSYGLWERRYASDPNILGKVVKVDGKPFTIVGVMGKGFRFSIRRGSVVAVRLCPNQRVDRKRSSLVVLGHLKPQVTIAQPKPRCLPSRNIRPTPFPTPIATGNFASAAW